MKRYIKQLGICLLFLSMIAFFNQCEDEHTIGEMHKMGAVVILESNDVWGDGETGYQLLLDSDHSAYGLNIQYSSISTICEYMIPEHSYSWQTWGREVIVIPAGTYDYFVMKHKSTNYNTYNIIVQNDNFEFEDGYTYLFKVERNGNADNVSLLISRSGY